MYNDFNLNLNFYKLFKKPKYANKIRYFFQLFLEDLQSESGTNRIERDFAFQQRDSVRRFEPVAAQPGFGFPTKHPLSE